MVQLWIETGATYPGTYAALRPGTPPTGHTQPDRRDVYPVKFGTVDADAKLAGGESVNAILKRRCMTCHGAALPLGRGIQKKNLNFLNVPQHYSLNLYNLTHPEKSMVLRAPLAKAAGGYGWCQAKTGASPKQPARIFADTHDKDYRTILGAIQLAQTQLYILKRFDMPDFRPGPHYVREMIRYGILPANFDRLKDPIDVYQTDRAYWRSLWYQPPRRDQVTSN